MKKTFVFCFLFSFVFGAAFAAPDLSQINAQIKQTKRQNEIIEQKVKSSDRDIAQTKKKLVTAADKVSSLEEQRAVLVKKLLELGVQHDKLETSLTENKKRLADAAATILFVSSHPSFDSENMHEYVLTSSVLSGASQKFDLQMQIAIKQMEELEAIQKARAEEKEKLDKTVEKYAVEKKDLDKLLRIRAVQNEKLKNQQYSLQQKLNDLSERAKNISELSAGVGSSEMSQDSRFSGRKMNSPVRGRLVVRFKEKTALGLVSDGWRIRVRGDSLVVAPADGIIKFADNFRGFGKIVIMSHKNGYNTVMTNLGSVDALVGQEVLAGEPIGRMDTDKPEMYLEVRRGNHSVDPARIFKEP